MLTLAQMIQDYHRSLTVSLPVVPAAKPKSRRVLSAHIIAMTFCSDISEMSDYRYHYGRTTIPVYALGSGYYCVTSGKKPDELELDWQPARDQSIASLYGKVLWFAPTRLRSK